MLINASSRAGKLVVQQKGTQGYSAFIPKPLPPTPLLQYDDEMKQLIEKANRALGRLDGATYILPNPDLFLFMFVKKEAVLSSQIEGTQASLADLLEYENVLEKKSVDDDVKEISNYVDAMNYGLRKLKKLPLSLRLIKNIHKRLLQGTRGTYRAPGEFRTSQNWIGGTMPSNASFVPPPPQEVLSCMSDLEKFIHTEDKIPPLIKAGLVHAQFETIHPFLDGNGRMGRLLITFMFCHDTIIEKPLLYLSLFFKEHKEFYYKYLTAVRRDGAWEDWIKFYLQGIFEVSQQATTTAKSIIDLQDAHRKKISLLGRVALTSLRLLDLLYQQPVVSVSFVVRELKLSPPAARKAIKNLEQLNILKEMSGKKRDRVYLYEPYMTIIMEGTEL